MFEAVGVRSVRLTNLDQSDLDEHYLLVRTEWLADLGPNEEPLPISSTFLLRTEGEQEQLRVSQHLNHSDVAQTLADRRARSDRD